jgi:hypothetical protein
MRSYLLDYALPQVRQLIEPLLVPCEFPLTQLDPLHEVGCHDTSPNIGPVRATGPSPPREEGAQQGRQTHEAEVHLAWRGPPRQWVASPMQAGVSCGRGPGLSAASARLRQRSHPKELAIHACLAPRARHEARLAPSDPDWTPFPHCVAPPYVLIQSLADPLLQVVRHCRRQHGLRCDGGVSVSDPQQGNANEKLTEAARCATHSEADWLALPGSGWPAPGTPDFILPGMRVAVFVHGCFWHRHYGCRLSTTPATNSKFWADKFVANRTRDHRAASRLRRWVGEYGLSGSVKRVTLNGSGASCYAVLARAPASDTPCARRHHPTGQATGLPSVAKAKVLKSPSSGSLSKGARASPSSRPGAAWKYLRSSPRKRARLSGAAVERVAREPLR